jgi:hypothetical protein
MVLLDAALLLVYELPYQYDYAQPAPSAARLAQIMVPTQADRAALSSASLVSKCVDAGGLPAGPRCEDPSFIVA